MEIKVRPIRSEEDYEAVLTEIDELMDAEPGTPRGDRLDVLVTLVEAYEARHWAIDLPAPCRGHWRPHGGADVLIQEPLKLLDYTKEPVQDVFGSALLDAQYGDHPEGARPFGEGLPRDVMKLVEDFTGDTF